MTFETWFETIHPKIRIQSAHAVLQLVAEDATVPFIARYRKEKTGNLDEVEIQKVIDAKENWDTIQKRQSFIVDQIEKQKKLTPELRDKVLSTFDLTVLEDIYLPYKQKPKTKATTAKEAGLQPLADWIWNCGHGTEEPQPGQTLELWAFTFRNEEKGISDAAAALVGAQDILIERLSETQELRQLVRSETFEKGGLSTRKGEKAKANSKFETYFEHSEPVSSLMQPQNSHRYLAMRRGWMEEELILSIGGMPNDPEFESRLLRAFENEACTKADSPGASILLKAARLALKANVIPSIESEVHKALKEVADLAAISVFAENVRKLLLASPFGPKAVLGVDPGVRTGCKLAVIDGSGRYVASTVIHLQSEENKKQAKKAIIEVAKNAGIRAIAVGNGTAGREAEVFIRAVLKEEGLTVPVAMVNEAGASVYSASDVAREEFPELDVTVRGAISIARRLQDPLAELVKIDPKSIGVGQYQHDVSQPALKRSLEHVVDSCVNSVGVNLNTASYHLLGHVSGIGPALAKAIVEHRGQKGLFHSRTELLDVPRFSKKAFEQSAGFLRIPEAENPLDNTGVHPESYGVLEGIAKKLGKSIKDLTGSGVAVLKQAKELAQEIQNELGEYTFKDVIAELEKPGRDPREEFVPFQYREDIAEVKDLKSGMLCPGIVTNVTNFGAFVDIGVHQDGLVHISQLSDRFVKDPREVVSPGTRVQVKILEVNMEKNQISLTMKGLGKASSDTAPRKSEAPRRSDSARKQQNIRPAGAAAKAAAPSAVPQGPKPKITPAQPGKPMRPTRPDKSGRSERPERKDKTPFNNAFGGLANLRNQLKSNS